MIFSCHLPFVSKIVGIDLGTTNSVVAVVEAGIPGVLADMDGNRLMPSVVYCPEKEKAIVGVKARRGQVANASRTILSVKRFIGRRLADFSDKELSHPFDIIDIDGAIAVKIDKNVFTPEEISSVILMELKLQAEAVLGEEVNRAVITVPAYFNDAQRQATKRAGELAGFAVERVLNEPTAAALAYGIDRQGERMRVGVYDFGGGTFDLSILELRDGIFEVSATHGDTQLGGDDIDQCVLNWLSAQITSAGGPDQIDMSMRARLREAAESAKIALSAKTETKISLPFLAEEFSFQCDFTRDQLESLAKEGIDRTFESCRQALIDARLKAVELDQIILVGGQTKMPLVRRLVKEYFKCSEHEPMRGSIRLGGDYHKNEGPALNNSQNPDETVALGAAVQGAILSGEIDDMVLLDVTPLSLGLETFGGLMNVIIPRNTTIPTKAGELFTNAVDGQKAMLIHVLQGEREKVKDNWSLGQFALPFNAARRGAARVGVQFEIDANGILKVLARDTSTGQEKVISLKSAVDVDNEEVQLMVEESVEHAFADLNTRRWVEGALRAREAINAARQGLLDYGDEVDKPKIEGAIETVERLLNSEDDNANSDSVQKLKLAVGKLDEVTEKLADLMIDRAMEEMLRERGTIR